MVGASTNGNPRPSDDRRKALREAEQKRPEAAKMFTVSDSFPIETYYKAIGRLDAAFVAAMDERRLDEAYVLGIRFATFSLECLPSHGAYRQKRHAAARARNARRVDEILKQVESVTERMDAEEVLKEKQRRQKAREKQQQEGRRIEEKRARKQRQIEELERQRQKYQQERKQLQLEEQKRKEREEEQKKEVQKEGNIKKEKSKRQQIEQSALAKLKMLQTDDRPKQENGPEKKRQNNVATDARSMEVNDAEVSEETNAPVLPNQKTNSDGEDQMFIPKTTAEEDLAIKLLQEAIIQQEDQIKVINEVKIPTLLREAKTKKLNGQRKEALHCMYLKRKWQRNLDALKGGIFKMETQILCLESAAEDREIAAVLKAATDTIEAIQSDVNVGDINHAMNEVPAIDDALLFDEEDLLRELMDEEELADQNQEQQEVEVSLLPDGQDVSSLPSVAQPAVDNEIGGGMPIAGDAGTKQPPRLLKATPA